MISPFASLNHITPTPEQYPVNNAAVLSIPVKKRARFSAGMVIVLMLAAFAFFASLHVSRTVFERMPHLEDEYAYLFQAKLFDGGQAWVPRDPTWMQVKDFWQPFVLQPDTPSNGVYKRFGKYSPGWPLLLAIGQAVDSPWIVNAWVAALVVVVIYRIGREIFDEAVGVVAALLMAISPMAILLNGTLMSHPSALLATMLFIYGYWRTTRSPRLRRSTLLWGLFAGLSLGWVVAERPLTAVAMAAPVALHILSRLFEAISKRPRVQSFIRVLVPAIILSIGTIFTGSLYFFFNYATTSSFQHQPVCAPVAV